MHSHVHYRTLHHMQVVLLSDLTSHIYITALAHTVLHHMQMVLLVLITSQSYIYVKPEQKPMVRKILLHEQAARPKKG